MLNPDFREFVQFLNANEVRYLVVGGYAVAFHGHPRYTKDIDIWVDLGQDNAARIVKTLADFGFGSLGLQEEDFLVPGHIIQLGHPPARIDLITTLDGVTFEECYVSRVQARVDDVDVKFIGLEGLKRNKLTSGRPQDLADLDHLH